jgi:integrase
MGVKIPTFDQLMNPLLRSLRALGGSGSVEEIYDKVVELERLPDEIVSQAHDPEKSNQTEVAYRLAWARIYLKKFGLLENSSRGIWSLTSNAKNLETLDPQEVVRTVRALVEKDTETKDPETARVGRALAHDEKLRLLKVAASKPEWQNARLAALLALNTTMRAGEIRGLRWQAVNLIERTITVHRNTTKTDAGERVIPLNPDAWAAVLELRQRAKLQFSAEPQSSWYVFPHAEGFIKPDPTKPMSGWRTAWRKLTRAIQCPACGQLQQPAETCHSEECRADIRALRSPLYGLRFHDLRHHCITELAESQTSDQTIMSIAGHVSLKMLARYSHVRMNAKRKALDGLSGGGSTGGYGTNNDTNSPAQPKGQPQVIDWWSRRGSNP